MAPILPFSVYGTWVWYDTKQNAIVTGKQQLNVSTLPPQIKYPVNLDGVPQEIQVLLNHSLSQYGPNGTIVHQTADLLKLVWEWKNASPDSAAGHLSYVIDAMQDKLGLSPGPVKGMGSPGYYSDLYSSKKLSNEYFMKNGSFGPQHVNFLDQAVVKSAKLAALAPSLPAAAPAPPPAPKPSLPDSMHFSTESPATPDREALADLLEFLAARVRAAEVASIQVAQVLSAVSGSEEVVAGEPALTPLAAAVWARRRLNFIIQFDS